ncbi:MAG: response regulator transcription factor [Chitinophagaceae bacterium]|nr:MAG: response regulator transcription factor [Chitinophagaceae bacterium]
MQIRTAVLDDEPLAVELLSDYVEKTDHLTLVEASTDVYKVLKMVQQNEIDLLLLDIQMPELTGIQFMKIIGDSCRVIITTAYTEYALDGYEFNVVDYLLKPISYERFTKAIKKLDQPLAGKAGSTPQKPDHIFIKSDYKLVRIPLADILYIESLRDYIAIHTTTAPQKIMSLESLRNMESLLPAAEFMRVHKSYIVAMQKISFVERNRVVINEQYIPIGESYQAKFFSVINKS